MNSFSFWPYLALALMAVFLLGLPDLTACPLPAPCEKEKRLRGMDWALILCLSVIYAGFAFYRLGDRIAPETSHPFKEGESAVLELREEATVTRVQCYSVLGIGSYTLELSPDGANWVSVGTVEQTYAQLLRWLEICPAEGISARYLRVTASGSPELGELCLRDGTGKRLAWASAGVLTDEQERAPDRSTYENSSYFDEIYHVRTAVEHIRGVWPYEISHPPLGKLIIALGITLFGQNPFGWRFMGTLAGVLMVPLMYVFSKKLFGGRLVPTLTALVLSSDFMHLVQTRIATIDSFSVLFILGMYLFLFLFCEADSEGGAHRLLYLGLSGLFFALGAATKWICLYAGAGLGLLWGIHWLRRFARERGEAFHPFVKNSLFCLLFFVAIPGAVYYASYYFYGIGEGLGGGVRMLFRRDYLRLVLDNQRYMFTYHVGVTASHPYSSRWYQWMLDIRPILYYLDYGENGTRASFGAFLNPMVCIGGLFCLFVLGYEALFRRERRAAFLLLAYLAQLVPWMFVGRITFAYHYFPSSAFLVLALGYAFSLMDRSGRRGFAVYMTGLCVLTFLFFYPQLIGVYLDAGVAEKLYQWLPTWPF